MKTEIKMLDRSIEKLKEIRNQLQSEPDTDLEKFKKWCEAEIIKNDLVISSMEHEEKWKVAKFKSQSNSTECYFSLKMIDKFNKI
jgi:hypothetical protein